MRILLIIFTSLFFGSLQKSQGQYWNDFELEPHSYRVRELQDPVTRFLKKVDNGEEIVNEANGKPLLKRLLDEFDIPVSSQVFVFTKTRITKLLRYFTFADEPSLGGKPIAGHGNYRSDFHRNKRVSRSGKSLNDLDMKDRLLRYRLSWMIYSKAFQGLPRALKEEFYYRLWNVLTNPESEEKGITHLAKDEKTALAEILADTVEGLPEYWKVGS